MQKARETVPLFMVVQPEFAVMRNMQFQFPALLSTQLLQTFNTPEDSSSS